MVGAARLRSSSPVEELIKNPSGKTLFSTDDTQMTIGVADTLLPCGEFREREKYLTELLRWAQTEEFKWQLGTTRKLGPWDSLIGFG